MMRKESVMSSRGVPELKWAISLDLEMILTIFIGRIQISEKSSVVVQCWFVSTSFGCEDAVVDDSVLNEESHLV